MANVFFLFLKVFLPKKRRALLILVTVALAPSFSSFGQTIDSRITGAVSDSATRKPLAFATVAVYRVLDTVLLTYRLTNSHGEFRIPSLPIGERLYILITYSGYGPYRKELALTENLKQLELGERFC